VTFIAGLRARAAASARTIVFPEASEPRTARAIAELIERRLMTPVAVGAPDQVREAIQAAGGDADRVEIRDPTAAAVLDRLAPILARRRAHKGVGTEEARDLAQDPLLSAALMVATGEADGAVAGAVAATADVLRAGLWCLGPAEGIHTVSSAFYMVVPPFRSKESEVLTFTDAGVVPEPNAAQLADIGVAAARARRLVVGDDPRVAFLSYSTKGSASGPSPDRVLEAVARFRELEPELAVDGELQGDAALISAVGARKAPGSDVAGRANVLVFPDLDAGNIAYKLVQRLTGGVALGPIVQGLRRPFNDLSRGAEPDEIVDVACITALMAGAQ
jgi:phosphate acetyltransferase